MAMWAKNFKAIKPEAKGAALILSFVGVAVYASGLWNPFMGDDNDQIVNNPAVHSLSHIGNFFIGGTFTGSGTSQLAGVYFRPLMTTSYALMYTLFGLRPMAFHLFQLALFILGSFLVFLVMQEFIRPVWALVVALVYLVHPLDSQAAFSIPNLQEPLYFVFGMTALWLVMRPRSIWALVGSGICLLLSLLSKETGIVFAGIILAYVWLFERKRLLPFIGIAAVTTGIYLVLKIHAVGFAHNAHVAPIDNANLAIRLINIPAIIWHYLGQFLLPINLASSYFWVFPAVSLVHFWLPLLGLFGLATLTILGDRKIRKNLRPKALLTYRFFVIWTILGLLPHLQFIPLDMTASDTWFNVSMVGILGSLGLLLGEYLITNKRVWLQVFPITAVIALLALRTAIRGHDWGGNAKMALADLKATPNNFIAEYQLANYFEDKGDYPSAEVFAQQSIKTFPTGTNWDVLGKTYMDEGRYAEAKTAYDTGIKHQAITSLYQDSAALTIVFGQPTRNLPYLQKLAKAFPANATIWTALAVAQYRTNHWNDAKTAIAKAHRLSPSNASVTKIYSEILQSQPLTID